MCTFKGLPLELRLEILRLSLQDSTSELTSNFKLVSREFYVLYNELFHDKLIVEFGTEFLETRAARVLEKFIKPYIKSFDYWRGVQRELIVRHWHLEPHDWYYRDSYQMVYSILKNRRLFATIQDYQVDEPVVPRFDNFVSISRTYLLSFNKTVELTVGSYNLSCGIIVENALGLSTTNFHVRLHESGKQLLKYQPPSNINEILPKNKFVLLNLGDFKVRKVPGTKLVKIDIIMEEGGLYIKSGFSICFIDINAIQPNHTEHKIPITPVQELATNPLLMPPPPSTTHRRRSSVSLNSSLAPVNLQDFNFHNFLFWYVENDISPPFEQNLCNLMLKNIYKALDLTATREGEIPLDKDIFDLSPYSDVENYNHNFYSKFCINNPDEKIKRVFKFITVIQQRNYDMEIAQSTKEFELRKLRGLIDDQFDILSPLKWKMQTLMQL